MADEEEQIDQDESGSQLDIATSFLSIILLYFIVLVAQTATSGIGDVDYEYYQEDVENQTMAFKRFRPINPIKKFWYVEQGLATEIVFSDIAQLLLEINGNTLERQLADGTNISISWGNELGVTGYTVEISRPKKSTLLPVTGDFWGAQYSSEQFGNLKFATQDTVFIERSSAQEELNLLARLTEDGTGPQIVFTNPSKSEGRQTFLIARSSGNFGTMGQFR
ncbi:hypothetical protein [Lentilitoribacter sp. EG35]|uniref:hypothetical protein n=1 Tax=Lentilitoribacter sp. EG35 TaxID=3234192 RepID=UPI003460F47B